MTARRSTWLQRYSVISLILVLALILLTQGYIQSRFSFQKNGGAAKGFVTRSGSQLLLNGQPFRFAGANIHWLALEDSTNYPSHFRVDDALDAAKEMGLTVVRSHSLGISTGCGNCIEPSRGVFNDTAFTYTDYAIAASKARGIRIIIPLVDNWHFPAGGKHNFTDWRSISDENQFYFNAKVIGDFEVYIRTLLNHVNIYTGLAYKNDPTIMAWETGNELSPTERWTQTITTYIKSIDSDHLIMDGRIGIDTDAARLSDVDIVSNHYYPKSISALQNDAMTAKKDGKVFIVGEYDWNDANGGDALSSFLSAIESIPVVAGDAFWELLSHNDQYGYDSSDIQYTLHYPGDTPAMKASVQLLRQHAYKMRNLSVPPDGKPGTPLITEVIISTPNNVLLWRGTALAANYTVERSTSGPHGRWTVICDRCATDTNTPWTDTTAPKGALWYRVIADNLSGVAGEPSNPYQAGSSHMIIDNLDDWSKTYQHSNNLTFDTTQTQYMNGDSSRVIRTTATNQFIIWRQTHITSFQAIAYYWPEEPISHFSIYLSSDGGNWILSHPVTWRFHDNWIECVYVLNGLLEMNYVKVVWNNTDGAVWNPNLGEVTLSYT